MRASVSHLAGYNFLIGIWHGNGVAGDPVPAGGRGGAGGERRGGRAGAAAAAGGGAGGRAGAQGRPRRARRLRRALRHLHQQGPQPQQGDHTGLLHRGGVLYYAGTPL